MTTAADPQPPATMDGPKTMLVGVDGSDSSLQALRWALREARLRGDNVDVLHCWHITSYGDMAGLGAVYSGDMGQESAEALLADLMEKVAAETGGLTVTSHVELGPAATTIIEATTQADLVVVGRRGHGGFLSLVMGSVAQQVAAHAHCPVVIVAAE